jgi:hypothetical protein
MMVKCRLREQSEKGLCPPSRLHTFKGRKRNKQEFYAWKPKKETAQQLAFDKV